MYLARWFAVAVVAGCLLPSANVRGQTPKQERPIDRLAIGPSAKTLRILVVDADGQTLTEFRVIAGVDSGSVTSDFQKRTGRKVVNWQPHTVRIGKDGTLDWPADRAYDPMFLRVEADGYQPKTVGPIKKAEGPQIIEVQLQRDTGVAGQVIAPDGKPAEGATVALALVQKDAVWENGRLRGTDQPLPEKPGDRWRRPLFVKTSGEGRFTLPTENEPAAILVVHESGVKELAYEDFRKSPTVTLDRWGKIEGRVLWQDKPGVDDEVTLSTYRDDYGYPGMVASYAKTQTDDNGRFTFEKVLPGRAQISRPMKLKEKSPRGATQVILPSQFTHVEVKAGEPTSMLIGGQGRLVTGKLVGRDAWKDVTFHFHPTAPHIGFQGDDEMWKAFGELRTSAIGPLLFRDGQPVKEDGTFEIQHMLPGSYQLFFSAPGAKQHVAYVDLRVPEETPSEMPESLDLGEVKAK